MISIVSLSNCLCYQRPNTTEGTDNCANMDVTCCSYSGFPFIFWPGCMPGYFQDGEKTHTTSQEVIKTYDKDLGSVSSVRVQCENSQAVMWQRPFGNDSRKNRWVKRAGKRRKTECNADSGFQSPPPILSCCLDGWLTGVHSQGHCRTPWALKGPTVTTVTAKTKAAMGEFWLGRWSQLWLLPGSKVAGQEGGRGWMVAEEGGCQERACEDNIHTHTHTHHWPPALIPA